MATVEEAAPAAETHDKPKLDPVVFGGAAVLVIAIALMGILIPEQFSVWTCLLYTSPSPRDRTSYRMPSSA